MSFHKTLTADDGTKYRITDDGRLEEIPSNSTAIYDELGEVIEHGKVGGRAIQDAANCDA